ncbi:MurR/RpiR family transcriptional regulator [Halobacillus litoralis]|uniref:MurR/RpiR family transcriptional regulator n=1 Tax=Halobacillus litoralis TaxID=45668 RepID=UPI001CD52D66|nr:MurR/RpiR family transcriptional regulator [Halobacillus litoralis]MCA1021118.1 MurR/RpiR family transcriptional regulator [Halobacillus litoralis]
MDDSILQTIKTYYPSLSQGQKKVASYLIDHKEEGAIMTASKLGRRVGVSETTVIRLAHVLGFHGYSHMQDAIRSNWLQSSQSPSMGEAVKEEDRFYQVAEQEKRVFSHMMDQLNPDELRKAADYMMNADRVFIGGFGGSYAAGYWFYYALRQLRERVMLSSSEGLMPEDMVDMDERSTVIIFSFPRYRREGKELVDAARKAGASIIAFTDKPLSPVGREADVTITTEERMDTDYHSIAGAVSVSEMVIQTAADKYGDQVQARQQKIELMYAEQGMFLE